MKWRVRCPACGHLAPWLGYAVPIPVRCVALKVTRQLRRQAERDGVDVATIAPICGAEFIVRPAAA